MWEQRHSQTHGLLPLGRERITLRGRSETCHDRRSHCCGGGGTPSKRGRSRTSTFSLCRCRRRIRRDQGLVVGVDQQKRFAAATDVVYFRPTRRGRRRRQEGAASCASACVLVSIVRSVCDRFESRVEAIASSRRDRSPRVRTFCLWERSSCIDRTIVNTVRRRGLNFECTSPFVFWCTFFFFFPAFLQLERPALASISVCNLYVPLSSTSKYDHGWMSS